MYRFFSYFFNWKSLLILFCRFLFTFCIILFTYYFILHDIKPKYLGPTSAIFTPEPGVQEIVLIVAPPACGKTTLSKKFDENIYYRINQDTLRTIDKCILKAKEELKTGKCMIMLLILFFLYSSSYFSSLFFILLFYSTVILSSHRFFFFQRLFILFDFSSFSII